MASNTPKGTGKAGTTRRTVSPARLQQTSGKASAYGGYEKVKHSSGTFSMRKTEK